MTNPLKQTIYIGDFEIVDVKPGEIALHFGRGVVMHLHTSGFPHIHKVGDKLPLYTEYVLCPPSTN